MDVHRGKLFTTSKVYKIWTSSPLTVCISAIKMVVYIAINHKLESRGKIVGGGREKNLDTKPLDPSLIESRAMAADWGSIVKTNKH